MWCKHCKSENVEIRQVREVVRVSGSQYVFVYDCNNCGKTSNHVAYPAAADDDEKEYAAPDENWQWCPPDA